jgi:metal-dependent amidase/aminoacylase/carboxypeptidase family protein
MIGARPPDADPAPAHHSPGFRIDEASLATGLRMMTATAARLSAGT